MATKTTKKSAPVEGAPAERKVVHKSLVKGNSKSWMTPEQRAQYGEPALEEAQEGTNDAE